MLYQPTIEFIKGPDARGIFDVVHFNAPIQVFGWEKSSYESLFFWVIFECNDNIWIGCFDKNNTDSKNVFSWNTLNSFITYLHNDTALVVCEGKGYVVNIKNRQINYYFPKELKINQAFLLSESLFLFFENNTFGVLFDNELLLQESLLQESHWSNVEVLYKGLSHISGITEFSDGTIHNFTISINKHTKKIIIEYTDNYSSYLTFSKANEAVIQEVEKSLNATFPIDYLEKIRLHNGGMLIIEHENYHIKYQIFPMDDMIKENSYEFQDKNYIFFASDESELALAFKRKKWPLNTEFENAIYQYDMEIDEFKKIANRFQDLWHIPFQ